MRRKQRYIAHVDMDAFFAAIEQRDNPGLRDRPVIVGADPKGGKGRGVVSTCSYEARRFGVHSAMPISIAHKKCPNAVFLPVDMEKYSRAADEIYGIFYDFTPHIEPVSIDEAFLDITGTYHLFGKPLETCLLIKSRIKERTGLTASVGLAPIKMAAKIASDLGKPDGLLEVTREGLLDFLWPLEAGRIWGLGKKTRAVLGGMGIRTVGELAKRDARELTDLLGKNGANLWKLANGMDERELQTEPKAKSVSNETTFDKDTSEKEAIEKEIMSLSERLSARLRNEGLKARTITLKIRLQGFHTYTRAVTMDKMTNFADVIYKNAKGLYEDFDTKGKKVRLLGIRASGLLSMGFQDTLFKEKTDYKKERVHEAVDTIRKKFGNVAIHRAKTLAVLFFVWLMQTCLFAQQARGADYESWYSDMRSSMVKQQLIKRGIKDRRVLDAMRKVERHKFVPAELRSAAYSDSPLPIGEGQTISQPYIVALMTELLEPGPDYKVLEIGTGSGYQAAVLAELCAHVYTVEILRPLAVRAERSLKELGYTNITVKCDDGFLGWEEYAPFDGIIVTCAPAEIPRPLIDQLRDGARLVIPVGGIYQELKVLEKKDGELLTKDIIPVRFVPMLRNREDR